MEKMCVRKEIEGLREADKALSAEQWARVSERLGEDAVEALREHYALFDERFYLWLADLYDPATGGFYYSTSARDTDGYLPDIESTVQALAFLTNSGMTASCGGHWKYLFPVEMEDKLLEFARSLQSPEDGYFYHPQWEGMTYPPSRLARDAGWATQVFDNYYKKYEKIYIEQGIPEEERRELLKKYMPDYNTPNGHKGRYGEPKKGRRDGDENSSGAAEKWTPQLRSLDAWREYLMQKPLTTKSYPVGNEVSSQSAQIRKRDKEAAEYGEPTGYVEMTREFFDSQIRSDNGVWEETVKYDAVNGLMKISGLYNSMGWELPYADKGIESAMYIALLDEPDCVGKEPTGSVDVYNPWVVISQIFANWKNCYKDRELAEKNIEHYRKVLADKAAEMIRATTKKTKRFAKENGAFGYTWGVPPLRSQGMPVSVPGIVEGDVNGGCISCTGVLNHMCSGLGISDIKPAIFYSADLAKFLERIEKRRKNA